MPDHPIVDSHVLPLEPDRDKRVSSDRLDG